MDWLYHYYIEHISAMWYLSNGWLLSDVHSQHVLTHLANAYAKACIQHHNLTNGISLLHRSQWSWPQVQNTWVSVSIWNTWKLIDLQKTTFLVKKKRWFLTDWLLSSIHSLLRSSQAGLGNLYSLHPIWDAG